jgi:hypothetical protein
MQTSNFSVGLIIPNVIDALNVQVAKQNTVIPVVIA